MSSTPIADSLAKRILYANIPWIIIFLMLGNFASYLYTDIFGNQKDAYPSGIVIFANCLTIVILFLLTKVYMPLAQRIVLRQILADSNKMLTTLTQVRQFFVPISHTEWIKYFSSYAHTEKILDFLVDKNLRESLRQETEEEYLLYYKERSEKLDLFDARNRELETFIDDLQKELHVLSTESNRRTVV